MRHLAHLALLAASACTRDRPVIDAPAGTAPVAEGSPPAAAVVLDPEARAACEAVVIPWWGLFGWLLDRVLVVFPGWVAGLVG